MDLRKGRQQTARKAALLLLAALAVLGIGAWGWGRGRTGTQPVANVQQPAGTLPLDPAAEDGPVPGFEAGAGGTNEADILSYRFCAAPYFPAADEAGELWLENPAENRCWMTAEIQLEDGRTVYSSGYLRPDSHIRSIRLIESLEPGIHPASIHLRAWTEEEEALGELTLTIQLHVEQPPV